MPITSSNVRTSPRGMIPSTMAAIGSRRQVEHRRRRRQPAQRPHEERELQRAGDGAWKEQRQPAVASAEKRLTRPGGKSLYPPECCGHARLELCRERHAIAFRDARRGRAIGRQQDRRDHRVPRTRPRRTPGLTRAAAPATCPTRASSRAGSPRACAQNTGTRAARCERRRGRSGSTACCSSCAAPARRSRARCRSA